MAADAGLFLPTFSSECEPLVSVYWFGFRALLKRRRGLWSQSGPVVEQQRSGQFKGHGMDQWAKAESTQPFMKARPGQKPEGKKKKNSLKAQRVKAWESFLKNRLEVRRTWRGERERAEVDVRKREVKWKQSLKIQNSDIVVQQRQSRKRPGHKANTSWESNELRRPESLNFHQPAARGLERTSLLTFPSSA